MTDEEYLAPSGETISKYKNGPYWYVTCDTKEENRWTKMYRNENEAILEFERWRK